MVFPMNKKPVLDDYNTVHMYVHFGSIQFSAL